METKYIDKLTVEELKNVIGMPVVEKVQCCSHWHKISFGSMGFAMKTIHDCMYIWCVAISDTVIIGSTWKDFKRFLEMLKIIKGDTVYVVYNYDFGQFAYHYFIQKKNAK